MATIVALQVLYDALVRLQKIQNIAARVIFRLRKFDHVTPALRELHWLPVAKRIEFKVLLLTFKCIHGNAPAYLQELIELKTSTRNLRSNNGTLTLHIPKPRTVRYGQRAFRNIAPKLWNKLPTHIRTQNTLDSFKKSLKTFLFKESNQ